MCIYGHLVVDPCKNIKINKRPPIVTLLSTLGNYWNEYGTHFPEEVPQIMEFQCR